MEAQIFYYNLAGKEKELELNFMVSAILKSRMKLGFEEGGDAPDEDVNIYLANLLSACAQHGCKDEDRRLISDVDADVYEMAEAKSYNAARYFIYKVNADHLLMSLGIFQSLREPEHYTGRAKIYYELAASYNYRIYRKVTAAGTVLTKLAGEFEKYQNVLANMRSDYFNFLGRVYGREFSNFMTEMRTFEERLFFSERQDSFLDMYSTWLKSHEPMLEKKICNAAKNLQIIDPAFTFNPKFALENDKPA